MMDCQETRQKLSMYADEELDEDELREVGQHLAQCRACSQAFAKQGAMDMLLKNHYSPEPPEGFADTFWPSVAERLDGPSGSDGAGRGDEEVVFRTSPAMQILDIPERRPKATASIPTEASAEAPPPASPWRWPVALIMSTAIAVVGFLYYKKTSQQQPQIVAQAPASTEPGDPAAGETEDQLGAASQPAAAVEGDGGMALAALTPGSDAGLGGATAEPGATPSKGRARARRGRKRGRGAKKAAARGAPAAAAPKAKAKAKAKARPKAGGSLDSLLDDALGGAPAPKATAKPKTAASPASNLPEQLNMNQIRGAMNKIKGRVQSCYDQHQVEGMAKVRFKISPTGKVASPSIRGKFRGTDTGDCVMKAVKKANFPKFSGKPMTISSYPFLLQ
jgi:Putative zinc-finger